MSSTAIVPTPGSIAGTAYLFGHLLRVLLHAHRVDIGDRWRHLSTEIVSILPQVAATSSSSIEFFGELCSRLGVQPTFPKSGRPVAAALHLDVVAAYGFAHGKEFEEGDMHGPGFFSVSWIDVMTRCPIEQLRALLRRGPAFFASMATQYVAIEARAAFLVDYDLFAWTETAARTFTAPDLSRAFEPLRWHVALTLLSPLSHGGDSSGSNVSSFRREDRVDAFTGEVASIPFVSGGAVRGLCRDLLMLDWLERIGLTSREVKPELAHSLLSGGSIDAGAAMGVCDNVLRDKIRAVCPPWDLFGGVIDGQFMEGQLLVGDLLPVCRETAWAVAPALGWSLEAAREKRSELPAAEALTLDRMATRRNHDDLGGRSQQMIFHVEAIGAGHQMAFNVALRAGPRASSVQRGALGHMLALLAAHGRLGAKAQAGFGQVALTLPAPLLAAQQSYLDYLGTVDLADVRAWLRGQQPLSAPVTAAEPAEGSKAKKGRGKKAAAEGSGDAVA